MSERLIDVEAVLKRKAPNVHFPKFFVRWLKRTIHQDEMNDFYDTHIGPTGFDFARIYLDEGLHCSASFSGLENIPQDDQPVIFVSNHPLGGLDGIILALLLGEKRHYNLRLIVNDLLLYIRPLACIFVPVNKVGAQNHDYARLQQELWDSGMDVLTFPAGACSRLQWLNHRFVICDLKWHKSFVRNAIKYHRNVVPIFFDGRNSRFFYQLAFWRKLLHIPFNIEMLYLVDEMYKASGKHFTLRVGRPISYTTFDDSRSLDEWAQYVKEQVYSI